MNLNIETWIAASSLQAGLGHNMPSHQMCSVPSLGDQFLLPENQLEILGWRWVGAFTRMLTLLTIQFEILTV